MHLSGLQGASLVDVGVRVSHPCAGPCPVLIQYLARADDSGVPLVRAY